MTESEAASVAALVFAATVMVVAWSADAVGLPIHPAAVLVLALGTTVLALAFTRHRLSFSGDRCAAFVLIVFGFTSYLCVLAWPSLLPITRGPDLVHHLTLIHFIQDRHALPHDPVLGAYMGEMATYTPGSHLLAALLGEWLRLDAIRIVHPLQALSVGLRAGLVFCALVRLLRASDGASLSAAFAGTLLLLLPHHYLLEPITVYGFYSQVVAEGFAVAVLWALVAFHRQPSRAWLALIGGCGAAVALSWPVYLPAMGLAIAIVVLFRWHMAVRPFGKAVGDVFIALGPAALLVAVHSLRHPSSAGILRSGGSVIVPSTAVFGWAFLLLTGGGLLIASRYWRRRLPVLAFAGACVVQAVALGIAQAWIGATNLYLASKTVFLLVYPLTILAGLALAFVTRPLSAAAGAQMKWRAVSILSVPLVAGVLLVARGLPVRPLDSPISEPVYRAGEWAKANVAAGCVDYMVDEWVTGYWLHLDVLGNPRASERMRTETFEYRRAVSRWILPGGPTFAIVEDLSALPADARQNTDVLHETPPAAVVRRRDRTGVCPDAAPPIDQVGRPGAR